MRSLYHFNMQFAITKDNPLASESLSRKRKKKNPEEWAGFAYRTMLQVAYITSMLCLLRSDEVLHIQWSDVKFESYHGPGSLRLKLQLPFRKTHQNGGSSCNIFDSLMLS